MGISAPHLVGTMMIHSLSYILYMYVSVAMIAAGSEG